MKVRTGHHTDTNIYKVILIKIDRCVTGQKKARFSEYNDFHE